MDYSSKKLESMSLDDDYEEEEDQDDDIDSGYY